MPVPDLKRIFCGTCGILIAESENFCVRCGTQARRGIREAISPRQLRPSRRGKSEWGHKMAIMVPGIVIVAVVVGVLVFSPPPEKSANVISIGKLSGDAQVQRCDNCTKITVGEESFPLKKERGEVKSLREYLFTQAESHPDPKMVELFNEEKQNRLFDISFDISGSVQNLDKRDTERGASVKYSDFMFGKLKEYLLSEDGITPGDTIALRLYGPALKDNACRQTLIIRYKNPQYEARYNYSIHLTKARVEIGKRLPSITTVDKGVVSTNDRDVVFAQAEKFFKDGLKNESVYCHNNTYIDQLFAQIAETNNEPYQSRHFVLLNDGSFMFHNTYVSPSDTTGVAALTKNAVPLDDPLCLNTKDTFTALGLDSEGNLSYRGVLTRFFSKILAPCSVDIRTN